MLMVRMVKLTTKSEVQLEKETSSVNILAAELGVEVKQKGSMGAGKEAGLG